MSLSNFPHNSNPLTDVSTHFAFGENWESYTRLIDEERLQEAEQGLTRLFGKGGLRGKTFLDVGCGSGLHAAAAARLGATRIVATDIDPISVRSTRHVLDRFAGGVRHDVHEISVFDLSPRVFGTFDVVYSWGVLHHTGAMHRAIAQAAQMVDHNGEFAFALYAKTPFCRLWTLEKRWYSKASRQTQARVQRVYSAFVRLLFKLRGPDFKLYLTNYKSFRGMDFEHDVHDWLGGYPYESISPAEVDRLLQQLGFRQIRRFLIPKRHGIFSSGCDEYVYRRDSVGSDRAAR